MRRRDREPPALTHQIPTRTDLQHFALVDALHDLAVQRIAEEHDGRDRGGGKAGLRRRVVHDHRALRVARQRELGGGAVFDGCLGELGHGGAAVGAEAGVSLYRGEEGRVSEEGRERKGVGGWIEVR